MEIPVNAVKIMLKHCKDKDFPDYASCLFYDGAHGALASFNPHSVILLKHPDCAVSDLNFKGLDTDALNFSLMKAKKTVDLSQIALTCDAVPPRYLSTWFEPVEKFTLESFNPEYLMLGFNVCKNWCRRFPSPECISMGNKMGLWHKKLTDDLEFFHVLARVRV